MSKVSALYHIVFCTRNRAMTIPKDSCEDLYRFIWHEIKSHNCKLIRIGGIQNHIHLLVDLHPGISLSQLVRDIKSKSSGWMRRDIRFCRFTGWGKEYYAASLSENEKQAVIEYIKNQVNHHTMHSLDEEFERFCTSILQQYAKEDLQ